MKTFKDLLFLKHENHHLFNTQAIISFKNGYGVSVITGERAYSNEIKPYELAVLSEGVICYTTYITDDVLGYLTEDEVTDVMIKVQKL